MSVAADGLDLVTRQRRALEALRAGVPCRDAVGLLGSGQPEIEDRFLALARASREPVLAAGPSGSAWRRVRRRQEPPPPAPGQLALYAGLAVSRVVISKETPLHDPVKVFRAAADSAVVAGRHGTAIAEAAAELDLDGPAYAELELGRLPGERPERAVCSHAPLSPGFATETRSTPMRSSVSGPATRCRPRSFAGG